MPDLEIRLGVSRVRQEPTNRWERELVAGMSGLRFCKEEPRAAQETFCFFEARISLVVKVSRYEQRPWVMQAVVAPTIYICTIYVRVSPIC